VAEASKSNILVIGGDDIGIWNLSCYSRGMMGYRTPNIDRLAAVAAIRTFLSYFLDHEMETTRRLQQSA